MKDIVIAGYARSPFHFANKGALTKVRPDDLAAHVVKGLVSRSGVNPDDIEDLILGCAFPEGGARLQYGTARWTDGWTSHFRRGRNDQSLLWVINASHPYGGRRHSNGRGRCLYLCWR